ncbi:MAG: NAD-dependent deacetylase [Arcobacter sp.]|nr:MAG: NAD-dependent deacetylase [Arcobacter sp.]
MKVIIFSGAGISAESGISTFRDSGGLWENHSVYDICSADSLEKNKELTLGFYNKRREELKNVEPNYAHKVITELNAKYPDNISIITQNVDDLFERSGCAEVMHLHGYLTRLKCVNKECDYRVDIGYSSQKGESCLKCDNELRPDIVFFGEEAPFYEKLYRELKDCEMLVVIGTSGEVIDVNFLRRGIKHTILNNLEPSKAINTKKFTKVLYKPCTQAIDEIIVDIEACITGDRKE